MTSTARVTKGRILKPAGFVHVSGWLPALQAEYVQRMIDASRGDVDAAQKKDGEK